MYGIVISMANEMTVKALKALADPTRLHIVELLSESCCGTAAVREDGGVEGQTAGEICCHITGAPQINSTISHHLHELEGAGLLRLERKGKSTVCTIDAAELQKLSEFLADLAKGTGGKCCC